jgi:hypothetical protein
MYTLTLTENDFRAIEFAQDGYAWAEALSALGVGENNFHEHEAWALAEAFESDTEGGHSPFPCLNPASDLYTRLREFWDSIV